MPLQRLVPGVGLHPAGIAEGRPVDLFVVLDEAEIGQQVFPADEDELLLRPAVHPLQYIYLPVGKIGEEAPVDRLHGLIYQVRDGLIVEVEGGTVHPGPFTELLHRDVLQVLFLQQGDEGLVHPQSGVEVFALGFVHPAALPAVIPLLR